jgi:RNA polymerase sigma-70 factor, ECF subfamily
MASLSGAIRNGYGILKVEPDSESDLVERACTGDSEAFGQLYERTLDRVYRYVYFRVTDDVTAEDLTSQVFLKAWESLPRYKAGKSPFVAWLYTIAHNAVIDYYRTKKQSAPLEEITSLPSKEPLPDEQYDTVFAARSLRQSLGRLTGLQRDVVIMKLIDGLGTEEIARRLGKSSGAIRALQMRGLQSLAQILRDEAPKED